MCYGILHVAVPGRLSSLPVVAFSVLLLTPLRCRGYSCALKGDLWRGALQGCCTRSPAACPARAWGQAAKSVTLGPGARGKWQRGAVARTCTLIWGHKMKGGCGVSWGSFQPFPISDWVQVPLFPMCEQTKHLPHPLSERGGASSS